MLASFDPNAEMGPTGMFVGAGVFALIACGTLISGLHPRWRGTATWRGLISRSVPGSLLFSIGALIFGSALLLRGLLGQHGPFSGVPALLFWSGAALLVLGPVYDLVRSKWK